MNESRTHASQPEQIQPLRDDYTDEHLRSIQTIEGGGPIRRIDMNTMPLPIKWFGYFVCAVIALMVLAAVWVSVRS